MSKSSSMLMWAAAVLFAGVYFFPLWTIDLKAPQYPDGLGINIWISKITGRQKHDLQNINGLNHYIGMKSIEPDEIPELKYMKFVTAALILFAAAVALLRRRWLLAVFVVVAIVLSAVGMYDFWQWEYDYGHDLNPAAAIKVPGMSYQPPLFGTKQLLNFTTTAWPGIGGWTAMLAVALSCVALLMSFWPRRRRRGSKAPAGVVAAVMVSIVTLASGCARGPQPIEYGADACGFCRMTISDARYGSEVVTKKGRVYKYDSIECLASALVAESEFSGTDVEGVYVTDFLNPNTLIDAATAVYLQSDGLPSPMGLNLTAFASSDGAANLQKERGGSVMDWKAANAFVAERKDWGQ